MYDIKDLSLTFSHQFAFFFFLPETAYFKVVQRTMSTGLNKQNIFIKDLYIQDQYLTERFCLFKAVLYIPLPPQKKKMLKIHIFYWFWLNSYDSFFFDVIYCQQVKWNEINRWKVYFIPTVLLNNKTVWYTWSTLNKLNHGAEFYSIIYIPFSNFLTHDIYLIHVLVFLKSKVIYQMMQGINLKA